MEYDYHAGLETTGHRFNDLGAVDGSELYFL